MPSIEAFQKLANEAELVRMLILKDFAPYSPDPDRGVPVAGFPADVALRIYDLGAGVPVDENLDPIQVEEEVVLEVQPQAPAVEIPENWKDHHVLVKARIAKSIIGENKRLTEAECDEIIAAEIERRSKADDTD